MKGYHSKQIIVQVLNSDDEEDAKEIERNKRNARAKGLPVGNPKLKKKQRTLHWYFDRPESPESVKNSNQKTKRRGTFTSNKKPGTLFRYKQLEQVVQGDSNESTNVSSAIGAHLVTEEA